LVTIFDVIEHLPKHKERAALKQVRRVLKPDGYLIISTPNRHPLANLLDPAWYFGHRHYDIDTLGKIVESSGFKIERMDLGGGFAETVSMIFFYIFKGFGREIPLKDLSDKLREKEYEDRQNVLKFATIFVKARKLIEND
jgi:SAM-dependent methyltransferase